MTTCWPTEYSFIVVARSVLGDLLIQHWGNTSQGSEDARMMDAFEMDKSMVTNMTAAKGGHNGQAGQTGRLDERPRAPTQCHSLWNGQVLAFQVPASLTPQQGTVLFTPSDRCHPTRLRVQQLWGLRRRSTGALPNMSGGGGASGLPAGVPLLLPMVPPTGVPAPLGIASDLWGCQPHQVLRQVQRACQPYQVHCQA